MDFTHFKAIRSFDVRLNRTFVTSLFHSLKGFQAGDPRVTERPQFLKKRRLMVRDTRLGFAG